MLRSLHRTFGIKTITIRRVHPTKIFNDKSRSKKKKKKTTDNNKNNNTKHLNNIPCCLNEYYRNGCTDAVLHCCNLNSKNTQKHTKNDITYCVMYVCMNSITFSVLASMNFLNYFCITKYLKIKKAINYIPKPIKTENRCWKAVHFISLLFGLLFAQPH